MNYSNPRPGSRGSRGRGASSHSGSQRGTSHRNINVSRPQVNVHRDQSNANDFLGFGSENRNNNHRKGLLTNTNQQFNNNRNNTGNNAMDFLGLSSENHINVLTNGSQQFNNNRNNGNNNRSANSNSKISLNNFKNPRQNKFSNLNDFYQTKKLLSEMLSEEYPENISLKLLDPQIQIKNFLNNVNKQDVEVVMLIINVTLKASKNKLMESTFRDFLSLVINSNFSSKRLDTFVSSELKNQLDTSISTELDHQLKMDMFHSVVLFFKLVFEILPGPAYESLRLRVDNIGLIADNLILKRTVISEEVQLDLTELKLLVESNNPFTIKSEKKNKKLNILDDNLDPPNDFRDISIFPNAEDLDLIPKNVFLRRNKMNGVYKSVDDYLDVQFRLMREDFIQPLREGLTYLKNDHGKKKLDIRIYRNVSVINSLPTERMGIIYNISFDLSRLKKVKWIQSKRFLYGSLLCLSNDNFKNLLFATVANRVVKDLEQGIISVKFFNCIPAKDTAYTLVETTNMFESYRHVLQKLQETNESNLCLQKYLVFADENISLPGYLNRNHGLAYVYSNKTFLPGRTEMIWPRAVEFELDESQFQAFKTSLTKEIAIIQGPPGTGKTYLGLKICHCLLENVQKHLGGFGPILVVCFTNHALDQFLEGILNFTKNIIRIGSRSKSEILEDYSLIKWKMKFNQKNTYQRRRTVFGKMREIKDALIQYQASLKMSYDSLISLERLRIFIPDSHFDYLKNIGIKRWLSGEFEEEGLSTLDVQLDNLVEWIIYMEMSDMLYQTIIESQVELMNNIEDDYREDNDMEVNYINNSRRLDIDVNDINDLNEEFETVIGKMRAVNFDEDLMPTNNDGFTMVKSKVEKQLFKKRLRSHDKMTHEEACEVRKIYKLDIKSRWKLYHYWKSRYVESLDENSKRLETEYEDLSNQLNELNFEEDRQVMMRQDIIGMTTTGAARYGRVLSQIQCKIIIVEEAAEVLESHIIGSLNPGCEHLILIGDHKQLKPNPTVYELAKLYNLDLSLFERLINNNLHFNTLELQHRMRPEIAEIMKFIYQNLKNHESVLTYPNVPSVSTNIFFFDHTEKETHSDEISSYSNKFEAEFVVSFCLHLMKNGIENSKITILTLYSGQLFLLRSMMPKNIFEGVRVCVVDNYQGEENEIIILSLVRSNELEKIGFLSIENRICVSLSRARQGLFVFGNFEILINQNKLWKDICFHLRKQNLLGDTLVLLCQNHPEKRLEVKNPEDFKKYPEGGCEQLCNQRLVCGHACRKACHFLDKNHQKVKCFESCTRLCPNGHRCAMKCWQECRNCQIPILKVIPNCNHQQKMPCYKDPQPDNCTNECDRVLGCGHKCLRLCRDKCGKCLQEVTKVSEQCGHEGKFLCSDEILVCSQKCNEILDCEHPCAGTCGKCNLGRLHMICKDKCQNQLICGHVCKASCSRDCPPCNEKCEEGCAHNACPKRCGDECVPCYEKCKWKCKHRRCKMKCYEICDRDVCDNYCEKMLDCLKCSKRFRCYGVCGEPCRKICLKCDPEVKEIFFGTEDNDDAKFITLWTCGHSFECDSMDRFMNNVSDNGEIVLKRCPKCNTIINKRSCFRYLNIVRKISSDIKKVQGMISKNEQNTNFFQFLKKLEIHSPKLDDFFNALKVNNYFTIINRETRELSNYETSKYNKALDMSYDLYRRFSLRLKNLNRIFVIDHDYIEKCLAELLQWLNPTARKFGQFDINQYECELERIEFIVKLTETRKTHPFFKEIPDFVEELKQCKSFSGTFSAQFKNKWKAFMDMKKDFLPNTAITELERKQIVAALGMGKGRWFKCPNGHFYVIGDCGGASQVAKCSECDALVGGMNHRVRDDNTFAPEMDHAAYPAFSEEANLLGYLGDLD